MSKQVTVISGYLDDPRFGTTKSGKNFLSCSVGVKVETDRGQNNEMIFTTYRYQFTIWGDKATDYHTRGVLVKGQYISVSGSVKMTGYVNDHPKNPADKGKIGINIDFLPGFDIDLGVRPADAPPVAPRQRQENGQDGQNGGQSVPNNGQRQYNNGYQNRNNTGGGGNRGNYQNRGGSNNYQGNNNYGNNYQPQDQNWNPPDQGQPQQGQPQQGQPNQYANNYNQSPYEQG